MLITLCGFVVMTAGSSTFLSSRDFSKSEVVMESWWSLLQLVPFNSDIVIFILQESHFIFSFSSSFPCGPKICTRPQPWSTSRFVAITAQFLFYLLNNNDFVQLHLIQRLTIEPLSRRGLLVCHTIFSLWYHHNTSKGAKTKSALWYEKPIIFDMIIFCS